MRLDFLNAKFHSGLNSTVRLGTRYVDLEDNVELYETGADDAVATGLIVKYLVCRFNLLSDEDIMNQHDDETTSYDGLYKAMKRAYKDEFDDESVVTVLYFLVA